MKDQEYIAWLEERITFLEIELYEAKKENQISKSISSYLFVTNNQLNNA